MSVGLAQTALDVLYFYEENIKLGGVGRKGVDLGEVRRGRHGEYDQKTL